MRPDQHAKLRAAFAYRSHWSGHRPRRRDRGCPMTKVDPLAEMVESDGECTIVRGGLPVAVVIGWERWQEMQAKLAARRQPVSHPAAVATSDATCPDPDCAHARVSHGEEGCLVASLDGVRCPCGLAYGGGGGPTALLAYLAGGPDEDDDLPDDVADLLTRPQLRGLACVACAADLDERCTQVGRVDGGQVFLCAAHELGSAR